MRLPCGEDLGDSSSCGEPAWAKETVRALLNGRRTQASGFVGGVRDLDERCSVLGADTRGLPHHVQPPRLLG